MTTTQSSHTTSSPTQWTVDPLDTTVGFAIRHLMVANVRGVFDKVQGSVRYDARRPEDTVIDIGIPVA